MIKLALWEALDKPSRLLVVFTYGYSLSLWHEAGIISRETRYYNELARHFDEIHFLTYGHEPDEQGLADRYLDEKIQILPKPAAIPNWLYSILAPFLHYSVCQRTTYVKTHQVWGAWTAVIARFLHRVPLVVRQGFQLTRLLRTQGSAALRQLLAAVVEFLAYTAASRIIVATRSDLEFIKEEYNIAPRKTLLIPNYIDIELFRNEPQCEKDPRTIVFVGRLSPEKNVKSLLAAIKGLDVELKIIGTGPQEEELRRIATTFKGSKVEFRGLVTNESLPPELNRAGIFVMPSLHEGSPKAIMEAMACGLPVVATNVPGTNDLVEHGGTGYLCSPDSDSIREAIVTLLEDENMKSQLACNARRFISENFSLDLIVEKELHVYAELKSGHN